MFARTVHTSRPGVWAALALSLIAAFLGLPECASALVWIDPINAAAQPVALAGSIFCSCSDGHGGAYLGGLFSSIAGVPRQNAAHLLSDGSVDAWNPAPDGTVTAINASDTTVYLGGSFTHVGAAARTRLAAVSSQTGSVTPWAPTADAPVAALARIGDRVFAGGAFTKINGSSQLSFTAIDANSGAKLAYQAPFTSQIYAITVRDTELFLAGEPGVLALSPTTAQPTRTLPQINSYAKAVAIAGDSLYLGGGFSFVGGASRAGIACVSLTNNSLTAWDPMAGVVNGLLVTSDAVYAAGALGFVGGGNRPVVARISRQTARAAGWATSPSTVTATTIIGCDRGLLVTTSFQDLSIPTAALPPADPAFPELSGPVFASLVSGDTLFLGGSFQYATAPAQSPTPYVTRTNLAAVRISTGELLDWHPYLDGTVRALVAYGHEVVALGSFTHAFSAGPTYGSHVAIARIDRATGFASDWDPRIVAALPSSGALTGEITNDTLYVGGSFSSVLGVTRHSVCAFDLRTGQLTAWNPDIAFGNASVECLARDGNRVFLGGGFVQVGSVRQPYLAEVDAVTGALSSWRPNLSSEARSLLVQGDALYVAGPFISVNGTPRGSGAAFSRNDGSLLPWNPHAPFDTQFMTRLQGGILLAMNSNYQTSPPVSALVWADATSGASIATLPVYTSDRIWTSAQTGSHLFVAGAYPAINGSTGHAFFSSLPAVSLATGVAMNILQASADARHVEIRAQCDAEAIPALERRELTQSQWEACSVVATREGGFWLFVDSQVAPDRDYAYRLALTTGSGTTHSAEVVVHVPARLQLAIHAIIPDPTTGRCAVRWELPTPGMCSVTVLDIAGRVVHREAALRPTGDQTVVLDLPGSLAAGVYVVRVKTVAGTVARHLHLIR